MADREKNNPLSTGSVNFNFCLNRQGAQGKKGEKGEEGFSPYITQGKNTLDEYTMIVTNENSSFETPNLREHKEDRGGTYYRYDRDTGVGYVGDANQATPELKGEIRIATQEDFDRLSGDTAVTPETLSSTNPLKLGYIDDRDETQSGNIAYVEYKTEITGDRNNKTISFESSFNAEFWENGVKSDSTKYYLLGQNSLKSSDGSLSITPDGKMLDLKANFPPAYTLPIATATVLGGIKIGEGLSISEDGTVSVTGSSYVLPAATATTLGGIKAETKTDAETNEVKIDPVTGKLYVAGGGLAPTNYVTTDTVQTITASKIMNRMIQFQDHPAGIINQYGKYMMYFTQQSEIIGQQGVYEVRLHAQNVNLDVGNGVRRILSEDDLTQVNQDVSELGNELNQLASDVTNIEGQIGSINTGISEKQDALTFKSPLNINTSGYNPTFLTDNKDGTFSSSIISSSSRSLIDYQGTGVVNNYIIVPCTDTTYKTIDWSKLLYYQTDNWVGKTFKFSGNNPKVRYMHFCKKASTFLPRLSAVANANNSIGTFAEYNGDIVPSNWSTIGGFNTTVGYWQYTGSNLPQAISGTSYSTSGTYLEIRFENENDSQYRIYFRDTKGGTEKSFLFDKSKMADVDTIVFTQCQNGMILEDCGVFDSSTGERLWSPLQTYIYSNDVVLNCGTGLAVQDSKLDINYDNLMVSLDHTNRVNLAGTVTTSGSSYTPPVAGLLCAGVKSTKAGDYVGISSAFQFYRDFRYAQAEAQWIAPQMPVNAGTEYNIEYNTANLTYCYFYPYKVSSKS